MSSQGSVPVTSISTFARAFTASSSAKIQEDAVLAAKMQSLCENKLLSPLTQQGDDLTRLILAVRTVGLEARRAAEGDGVKKGLSIGSICPD